MNFINIKPARSVKSETGRLYIALISNTNKITRFSFLCSAGIKYVVVSVFLVVKHTVAVALKVGVGNLIPELLAHAFVVLDYLGAAGTVAPLFLKTFLDYADYFLVLV